MHTGMRQAAQPTTTLIETIAAALTSVWPRTQTALSKHQLGLPDITHACVHTAKHVCVLGTGQAADVAGTTGKVTRHKTAVALSTCRLSLPTQQDRAALTTVILHV
jgi:hypothetical protein